MSDTVGDYCVWPRPRTGKETRPQAMDENRGTEKYRTCLMCLQEGRSPTEKNRGLEGGALFLSPGVGYRRCNYHRDILTANKVLDGMFPNAGDWPETHRRTELHDVRMATKSVPKGRFSAQFSVRGLPPREET